MAEEFQAAICGENWWNINTTRSILFPLLSSSSTCSIAANDAGNYNTWQSDFMDLKATTRSCVEETNNFVSEGFLDIEKQQQSESSASGTDSILIDSSTLQMMGFGMSSSTSSDWNQSLFGRAESNFHSVLQEGTDSSQIQTKEFSIDQQSLMNNSISSTGFPIGSSVNDNSYGYPSTVMQSLFDPTEPQQQQQQPQNSLFTNPSSMSSYSSSSILKPSMPKQSGLHFSNNTAFWNASAEALNDIRSSVFASSQTQYHQTPNFHEKNNSTHNNTLLNKLKREESPDASTAAAKKSSSSEPVFKRPRIETPSPLPTFKVRKEKLGDRITALQQLVSPFGKTDTASVLHEAIEYIKFLHDQVNVLSTPYLTNGATVQHQQGFDNMKEMEEEGKQDLRSRGLCLVPISSTFPVANETVIDFWTPTFGGPLIGR